MGKNDPVDGSLVVEVDVERGLESLIWLIEFSGRGSV